MRSKHTHCWLAIGLALALMSACVTPLDEDDSMTGDPYSSGLVVTDMNDGSSRYELHTKNSNGTYAISELKSNPSQPSDTVTLSSNLVSGNWQVLVVLVNFADNPTQPYTVETARNVIFGTTHQYFQENSFNTFGIQGDVLGWYTIDTPSTSCEPFRIRDAALAAVREHGRDPNAYSHYLFAFPQNACGFSGSGTIGGSPTYAWINRDMNAEVVSHEMLHNAGLYHSHALECDVSPITQNCSSLEYGDIWDVMGDSDVATINAFQRERMGWIGTNTTSSIQDITKAGDYDLFAFETNLNNTKALRIKQPGSNNNYYYLEHRIQAGFDKNLPEGVRIHRADPSSGNSSYLLDPTPNSTVWWEDWNDAILTPGSPFVDGDVRIEVLTQDKTKARIRVAVPQAIPSSPTPPANPTGSSPSCPAGSPEALLTSQVLPPSTMLTGQPADVSFTFKNCSTNAWTASSALGAGAGIKLGSQAPANNTTWGTARMLLPNNVKPGESVTVSFPIIAPRTVGTYSFSWQLVDELVRWIPSATPIVSVQVYEPPAGPVCPSGSPNARFIKQTAPPTVMAAGSTANVSVTFANCSTSTWVRASRVTSSVGYKLGSVAPTDGNQWGKNRVALPFSTYRQRTITIPFTITAPTTPGTYDYAWEIVSERRGWLDQASTPLRIRVLP